MFEKVLNNRVRASALLAVALLVSSGARAQSLYDRLGGQLAVGCWVDTGLTIITANPHINDYFAGELNVGQAQNLRDSLVSFACAATGGPCVYPGRDMACAHAGLSIDHDAFTGFLQDLEQAAIQCRRGNTQWMTDPAYSELNKLLLSLRSTIVQDDPGENPKGTIGCP